jgi:hypothetical protein
MTPREEFVAAMRHPAELGQIAAKHGYKKFLDDLRKLAVAFARVEHTHPSHQMEYGVTCSTTGHSDCINRDITALLKECGLEVDE